MKQIKYLNEEIDFFCSHSIIRLLLQGANYAGVPVSGWKGNIRPLL